jgi:hypothetical protein
MKTPTGTTSNYWVSLAYSGKGKTEYPILTGNTLGPDDRQSSFVKGASPFLVQFPSGETVLSYNNNNYIYVRSGDETARTFGDAQTPFPQKGFWSGMYVDGGHRLLLATGGSNKMLQLMCLYLNHDITASPRSAVMDGSNSEWQNSDDALFVGAKSQAQATLRCSVDADNLYLLIEVQDENISVSDYATVILTTTGAANMPEESVRIQVSAAGLKSQAVYRNSWLQENLGIEAASAIDGTAGKASDVDKGWICEVRIPKSSLPVTALGKMSLDFLLFDIGAGEESVAPSSHPLEWPQIAGL